MSRVLQFRAWDKMEKRFILPDKGYQGHFILDLNGQFYNLQNGSGGEEYEVQQFTGLKDKNGKEIFEGDIINIIKENKCYPVNFGTCFATSDDNYCGTECFGYYIDEEILGSKQRNWGKGALISENMEVIGNIFQTPDLINL